MTDSLRWWYSFVMVKITQHTTVLTRLYVGETHASFIVTDDDTGKTRERHTLPRNLYDDLGEPQEITVIIMPGDSLNRGGLKLN